MAKHDGVRAGNPKILLAEDDPGVRRALQMLLLGGGYDVRSYASSLALLADKSARDALCLVTDYRMPGLDGLALLRALREAGWTGKAVLITAFHTPELVQQAITEGFDMVFDKPLQNRAVMDALARLAPSPPKSPPQEHGRA